MTIVAAVAAQQWNLPRVLLQIQGVCSRSSHWIHITIVIAITAIVVVVGIVIFGITIWHMSAVIQSYMITARIAMLLLLLIIRVE